MTSGKADENLQNKIIQNLSYTEFIKIQSCKLNLNYDKFTKKFQTTQI